MTTRTTPIFTTALSSPSVPFGSSALDTATVTGNASFGAPTGTVTFEVCGPTAAPIACTSPNVGPATEEVSRLTTTSSTARVTIEPGAPGWYCFLDTYSGDSHYTSATDNSTSTECLDVTTTAPTKTTPTFTTALSSPSVPFGSSATDTAAVTGNASAGAPTGTVTFAVCGPTTTPTPCTSPNVSSVTVGLSQATTTSSTATVTIEPGAPGWYCFLDTYSGDSHYTSATDNSTSTECLDVTSTAPTKTTPTFTTSLSSPSVAFGNTATDTATVTGTTSGGAPSGTVTFALCGPTTTPTPCISPNVSSVTVGLSAVTTTSSSARVTIEPGAPGWYCFLDTYSGDSHYTSATDNSTSTECLDVTSTAPTKATPTFTTALSSPSVPYGSSATDTATVTGNTSAGAPTGTVNFAVCGPTTTPTPCTSPNVGSVTVGLSQATTTSSTARVTIEPGAPGWYCFLDTYSGDSHYTSATDNSTSTECLDVTTTAPTKATPAFSTVLSSPSVPFGTSAVDFATVTGNAGFGAPTGTVTFEACGPTATAMPCTAPTIGPATVGLTPESNTTSTASVTIEPGAPGWYCFLDIYSGDGHYTSATDNNTSTECLDVTTSQVTANAASPGPTPAIGAGSTSTTGGPAVLIGDTPSPASSAMEARRPL